jgi:hypothetical protein
MRRVKGTGNEKGKPGLSGERPPAGEKNNDREEGNLLRTETAFKSQGTS